MARFKHNTSGAVVVVREGKVLGSEWEPVKADAPTPAKKAAPRKQAAKKSE